MVEIQATRAGQKARYFFFAVFFLAAFFLGAAFLAAFFLATVRPPKESDGDFLAACRAGAEARQVRRHGNVASDLSIFPAAGRKNSAASRTIMRSVALIS